MIYFYIKLPTYGRSNSVSIRWLYMEISICYVDTVVVQRRMGLVQGWWIKFCKKICLLSLSLALLDVVILAPCEGIYGLLYSCGTCPRYEWVTFLKVPPVTMTVGVFQRVPYSTHLLYVRCHFAFSVWEFQESRLFLLWLLTFGAHLYLCYH